MGTESTKGRTNSFRDRYCTEVEPEDVGRSLQLAGWVDTRRDHGGVIFVDLRDRTGLIQLVIDEEVDPDLHDRAGDLRKEFVVRVEGVLEERPEETVNPELDTGQWELHVKDLDILNRSETPPFELDDAERTRESLRLKHRYLDLRRPRMNEYLQVRHRVCQAVRRYLSESGFIEVETPVLTRSTPEGARDFVVPSRLHPGEFYALPQSPQLFKQILMVSGMDRYFQLVKCFRDEDLRADRQPEFTQIDIEASFVNEEDVFEFSEGVLRSALAAVGLEERARSVPRLTYDEAIRRYGTDDPDTRFDMELHDVSDVFEGTELRVFQSVLDKDGIIKCMVVPGGAEWSRSRLDGYTEQAQELGAGGLAWLKVTPDGWESPIADFVSEEERDALRDRLGLTPGDCPLFVADDPDVVNDVLSTLRETVAGDEGMIPDDEHAFLWVTEFPLVEYDREAGRYKAMHHPFTAPTEASWEDLPDRPEKAYSKSYDLVWNGVEIGGGSMRNYELSRQKIMFETLGIGSEEAEEKFGFLLDALQYGAPPHGGIAFGLDRLIMLLVGADSIREVMAFPKTQRGVDPLTEAPARIDEEQLDELHLEVFEPDE